MPCFPFVIRLPLLQRGSCSHQVPVIVIRLSRGPYVRRLSSARLGSHWPAASRSRSDPPWSSLSGKLHRDIVFPRAGSQFTRSREGSQATTSREMLIPLNTVRLLESGPLLLRSYNHRKEETVLARIHIGHTHLTHGYSLRSEEPPFCVSCD